MKKTMLIMLLSWALIPLMAQSMKTKERRTLRIDIPEVEDTFSLGRRIKPRPVQIEMVWVEGGVFEQDCDFKEKPAHPVTLSDYYIGKCEVTQKQWVAVMGNNPSYFKGDNLPVEQVSWDDCREFIAKLNCLTGRRFRLPAEAEWEYAARGGKGGKGYEYSGSSSVGNVAWYLKNSRQKTHSVGTKRPNELGIYDMSGNVWEWCSDWYGTISPADHVVGSNRVYRGVVGATMRATAVFRIAST